MCNDASPPYPYKCDILDSIAGIFDHVYVCTGCRYCCLLEEQPGEQVQVNITANIDALGVYVDFSVI